MRSRIRSPTTAAGLRHGQRCRAVGHDALRGRWRLCWRPLSSVSFEKRQECQVHHDRPGSSYFAGQGNFRSSHRISELPELGWRQSRRFEPVFFTDQPVVWACRPSYSNLYEAGERRGARLVAGARNRSCAARLLSEPKRRGAARLLPQLGPSGAALQRLHCPRSPRPLSVSDCRNAPDSGWPSPAGFATWTTGRRRLGRDPQQSHRQRLPSTTKRSTEIMILVPPAKR